MAEPIVRELMRADHVDPAAFEALLRSIAARSSGVCAAAGQASATARTAIASGRKIMRWRSYGTRKRSTAQLWSRKIASSISSGSAPGASGGEGDGS